ncbi:PAS domain S-box protein [Altericista sp. CCNU0014]|uniref:PAS domain-containing sensor histidine kinase n=1 Tax=Altericista sp. CCNU0014 TaxID=3082949 RepID=UPI00385062CC
MTVLPELRDCEQHGLESSSDRHRLEAFFSQSPDGFFFMMLDRPMHWDDSVDKEAALDYVFDHQRVTRVNAAMLAQYNASEADFLGLTPKDFFAHDLETGRQLWREMFDRGRLRVETLQRRLDGTSMWIEGDYSCLYDSEGNSIGHFGIQRDISSRKQEEEELREMNAALSHTVEGISKLDASGRYQRVDQAYANTIGYRPEDTIGMEWQRTVHPDDLDKLTAAYQEMLSAGKVKVEAKGIRKDGSTFYKQLTMVATYDKQQQLTGHYCFMKDISESARIEAEREEIAAALRESEENFRILATHAPVGIFQTDPAGDCVFVNRKWMELTGLSFARAMGRGWTEALYAEDRERVFEEWYEAVREDRAFFLEYRFETPQGEVNWVVGSAVAIRNGDGVVTGYFGTVTDINAAKQNEIAHRQVEEDLRRSEQKFRAIFNSTFQFIGLLTPEGIVVEVNQAALRVVAAERADAIGKPFWETPWWTHFPQLQERLKQAIADAANGESVRFESEHIWADGSTAFVDFSLKPVLDEVGNVVMLIPEGRDISDRKQALMALQESEERLQALIDNAGSVIYIKNPQGQYILINRQYETLFHLERENVKGKTDRDIFPEYIADAFRANDLKVLAAGIPIESEEIAPQDDGLHTFLTIKFPLLDASGVPSAVCGISTDITERKKAEVELQQQKQDLARSNDELQQFAYVASHDLQEPLRMVTSYLELLERRYKGQLDPKADRFIAYAVDGATRMQILINDLLGYSRVGSRGQSFGRVDCAAILKNVLRNLQVAISENNAIVTHDPLPEVNADATQLTQLFQNLIGNAIKFRGEDPPRIQIGVNRSNGKWLFSVCDNGIGIESQYISRIFVIFQRLHSRADYPGTGMGLAICKKIVERHGGKLWVESLPGEGSTFYFTLSDAGAIPS